MKRSNYFESRRDGAQLRGYSVHSKSAVNDSG
jgi:hypothetical protein